MRFLTVASLSTVLVLSACFGPKEPEIKLKGERIDVLVHKTVLTPTDAALNTPLHLPKPIANPNWAQVGGTANHAPVHVYLPEKVTPAWTANIGHKKGVNLNAPVVFNGRLFTFNTRGEVLALDAKTGEEIWRNKLTLREADLASFTGGLAAIDGHLFVTTATGEVFALNTQTGEEIWKIDVEVPLRAAPTFFGGGVFVTSYDNRLFAINAANGKVVWTHSGAQEGLSLLGGAAPAAAYGVIAAAYSGGDLYLLKASNGEYIWHDAFANTSSLGGSGDPFSGLNAIAAPPVMADGVGYAVSVNGRLTAFHLKTGQRLWNVGLSAAQMPWVAGFGVFVVTDNDELVALSRKDGEVRWIKDLNSTIEKPNPSRVWTGPVLAGGRLIVASSDGYAMSFNPKDGVTVLSGKLMKNDGVSVPPIVADGRLYFLTDKGRIIAYE